jgi:hypothetical protein
MFRAILGGERVAEHHEIDGGLGEELLDVWEATGGLNAEASLFEYEAAGVSELIVAAKDKHGSGRRHKGRRGRLNWQDEVTR